MYITYILINVKDQRGDGSKDRGAVQNVRLYRYRYTSYHIHVCIYTYKYIHKFQYYIYIHQRRKSAR